LKILDIFHKNHLWRFIAIITNINQNYERLRRKELYLPAKLTLSKRAPAPLNPSILMMAFIRAGIPDAFIKIW